MSFINRRNGNKKKNFFIYLIIILLIAAGAFIYLSPMFERNNPKVFINNNIFWNLKAPLSVKLEDDTKIKSYSVTYFDGQSEIKLETELTNSSQGVLNLDILAPKLNSFKKIKELVLKIEVVDTSKWNFFVGNKTIKNVRVKIDQKKPLANVISNSYLIRQGGSAAIVVEVRDTNLKDLYISFNNKERFELIPFYKDGFYMAIITWPIDIEEYERVNLVAVDEALNKTTTKVPLYIKSLKVKVDKLKISDKFINKISKNVLQKSGLEIPSDPVDIFIEENSTLRNENVNAIKEVSRKKSDLSKVNRFTLKAFRQLKRSKQFAGFGERRHYYYDNEKIDEAWHLGMDWASIKKAKIYSSNEGKVIFKDYLGIYGNTIIIDHKYGVSSLYAHTSRSGIEDGDFIRRGKLIANTGSTGAVFGDHLHFGILIQGIEANPKEWMDAKWIRTNISNVINESKRIINSK